MRPTHRWISLAGLVAAAMIAAACSSAAATPPATLAGATDTPAAATPAVSQAATTFTVGVTSDAKLGAYLTGATGMTLYIYTADTPDVSNCSGGCATAWPPLTVQSGVTITPPAGATAAFATITRSDGTLQVTFNHWPLYYYAKDTKAGDVTGQGVGGKWFVAPLSGALAAPTDTASSGY